MALIKCPECGRERVSDSAVACPSCGFNIREYFEKRTDVSETADGNDYYYYCSKCGKVYTKYNDQCAACGWINHMLQSLHPIGYYDKTAKERGIKVEGMIAVEMMSRQGEQASCVKTEIKTVEKPKPQCPKCRGTNLSYSIVESKFDTVSRSEMVKKGALERASDSFGRGIMIAMTGGLWALTPKKSKYKNIEKAKSHITHKKMALCQDCGYSWDVK